MKCSSIIFFIGLIVLSNCKEHEEDEAIKKKIVVYTDCWFESCADSTAIDSLLFNTWVFAARTGELRDTIISRYSIYDQDSQPIVLNFIDNGKVCGVSDSVSFEIIGKSPINYDQFILDGETSSKMFLEFAELILQVNYASVKEDSLIFKSDDANNVRIVMVKSDYFNEHFFELDSEFYVRNCTINDSLNSMIKFSYVVLSLEKANYFTDGLIIGDIFYKPIIVNFNANHRLFGFDAYGIRDGSYQYCSNILNTCISYLDHTVIGNERDISHLMNGQMYITKLTSDSLRLFKLSSNSSLYFLSKDQYFLTTGVNVDSVYSW